MADFTGNLSKVDDRGFNTTSGRGRQASAGGDSALANTLGSLGDVAIKALVTSEEQGRIQTREVRATELHANTLEDRVISTESSASARSVRRDVTKLAAALSQGKTTQAAASASAMAIITNAQQNDPNNINDYISIVERGLGFNPVKATAVESVRDETQARSLEAGILNRSIASGVYDQSKSNQENIMTQLTWDADSENRADQNRGADYLRTLVGPTLSPSGQGSWTDEELFANREEIFAGHEEYSSVVKQRQTFAANSTLEATPDNYQERVEDGQSRTKASQAVTLNKQAAESGRMSDEQASNSNRLVINNYNNEAYGKQIGAIETQLSLMSGDNLQKNRYDMSRAANQMFNDAISQASTDADKAGLNTADKKDVIDTVISKFKSMEMYRDPENAVYQAGQIRLDNLTTALKLKEGEAFGVFSIIMGKLPANIASSFATELINNPVLKEQFMSGINSLAKDGLPPEKAAERMMIDLLKTNDPRDPTSILDFTSKPEQFSAIVNTSAEMIKSEVEMPSGETRGAFDTVNTSVVMSDLTTDQVMKGTEILLSPKLQQSLATGTTEQADRTADLSRGALIKSFELAGNSLNSMIKEFGNGSTVEFNAATGKLELGGRRVRRAGGNYPELQTNKVTQEAIKLIDGINSRLSVFKGLVKYDDSLSKVGDQRAVAEWVIRSTTGIKTKDGTSILHGGDLQTEGQAADIAKQIEISQIGTNVINLMGARPSNLDAVLVRGTDGLLRREPEPEAPE